MSALVVDQAPIGTGLLGAFRTDLARCGRSPKTCDAYCMDAELFRSFLRGGRPGEPDWGSVPRAAVAAYFAEERGRGRAAATLCRRAAALRAFLGWLERRGYARPGLAGCVPRQLGRADVDASTLSEVQIDQLCGRRDPGTPAGLRDAALLRLLWTTGLRISEAVGLDVDDLDTATLRVRSPGRDAWRLIVLEEDTRAAIAAYVRGGRAELVGDPDGSATPALFVNVRGERLTRQGAWLRIAGHARAVGLPCRATPALLRRTAALGMLRRGVAAADVAASLGCTSSTWLYRLRGSLRENGR